MSDESQPQPEQEEHRPRKRRFLRWPRVMVDLSKPKHRRILVLVVLLSIIVGTAFLYGNYKIYTYTESSEFCGTVCHVMDPQFVRYEESAHASVECAECHIGPGTSFFVKSKLDGLSQVVAVLTDNYARPITSPVHDLRPARETCETCHNPASFEDNIIKVKVHFDEDAENTRIESTLILKMGGWQGSTGDSLGIHWHITNPVYYIAADDQRQAILWVGEEQPDGTMKEYYSRDVLNMANTSFVEEAKKKGDLRQMDCIDCHNRTAHYVPSPQEAVDEAIETGRISQAIPYVRAKAIEVLTGDYRSRAEAYAAIDDLADFFAVKENLADASGDPSVLVSDDLHTEHIDDALLVIKEIYDITNFPEMGLDWQTNPNNERHTPSLGCFRCHDGKHISVNEEGQEVDTISVECNLCHTVPIVGRGNELIIDAPVITGATPDTHAEFRWTIEHRDISPDEEETCYQCHGTGFCNNAACHNLSHPPDMLFTHAEEYYKQGDQVCYTCHQNMLCSRCHPGGIVENP